MWHSLPYLRDISLMAVIDYCHNCETATDRLIVLCPHGGECLTCPYGGECFSCPHGGKSFRKATAPCGLMEIMCVLYVVNRSSINMTLVVMSCVCLITLYVFIR